MQCVATAGMAYTVLPIGGLYARGLIRGRRAASSGPEEIAQTEDSGTEPSEDTAGR